MQIPEYRQFEASEEVDICGQFGRTQGSRIRVIIEKQRSHIRVEAVPESHWKAQVDYTLPSISPTKDITSERICPLQTACGGSFLRINNHHLFRQFLLLSSHSSPVTLQSLFS